MSGTKTPTENNHYLSETDGLYYNGYLDSPEAVEDAYGNCFKKIAVKIERELREELGDEAFEQLVKQHGPKTF